MKQIYTWLKALFAVAVIFAFSGKAFAYPTLAEIYGKYDVTSTVTGYVSNTYANASGSYTLTIADGGITGFLGNLPNITYSYDQSTGVLTFTPYSVTIPSASGFGSTYYCFYDGTGIAPQTSYQEFGRLSIQFDETGQSFTMTPFEFGSMVSLKWSETLGTYTNTKGTNQKVDSPLNGEWTFILNDNYVYSQDLTGPGQYVAKFNATVNGNEITFKRMGIATTGQLDYNIVATIGDNNTLTFDKAVAQNTLNPIYQVPYTNAGASFGSLNTTPFTATYDAAEGKLNFSSSSVGLRYSAFTTGGGSQVGEWIMAVDILSAVQGEDPNAQPTITIGFDKKFEVGTNSVTASYEAEVTGLAQIKSWGAVVTEMGRDDKGDETSTPVESGYTVSYENGYLSITINNVSAGNHSWNVIFQALDAQGEVLASSKQLAITLDVKPSIMVRDPKSQVEGNSIKVTVQAVAVQAIPEGATYQMIYVPSEDIEVGGTNDPDYETNAKSVPATLSNDYFTATIPDLEPGTYAYHISIAAYNGQTLVAQSDFLSTVATVANPDDPALTVSDTSLSIEQEDDAVNISVSFTASWVNFEYTDVAEWVAEFSYKGQKNDVEAAVSPTGSATVTLIDMPEGEYAINMVLYAYDSNEEVIAQSEDVVLSINTSGITSIGADSEGAVYYNLSGVRVNNPTNGLYIKVQGEKATKVLVK